MSRIKPEVEAKAIDDQYVRDARMLGYPSRAAFKLHEIIAKERKAVGPLRRVLDLGAAPGGWTTVLSRVQAKHGGG
eukprot:CAMPEP_0113887928 /NCGR_PEP_ID=MMETSP0780_2-20120614/12534_1 /TAXON_ID=652834 /ORGANISM="Palpitomonas bilix" /LENGTH=75 /DNA_ID=CAMNT_0000876611 /DNA_START=213 /DNA_END=437 /DNA_ORIENTATION=- /assembly_acc=CAM_ASM_000599